MNSAWNLEKIQVSLSNFGEQAETLRICLKEPSVLISSFIFCHRSDCHSGCFDDKWWHRAPCHLCSIRTMVTVSALIKMLNKGGHFKPLPLGGPFQIKEQWPVTQKLITHFPSSNVNTSTPTLCSRGASQTQQCAFFPSTRVWWRASGYISKPFDSTHCIFMHFKLHERKSGSMCQIQARLKRWASDCMFYEVLNFEVLKRDLTHDAFHYINTVLISMPRVMLFNLSQIIRNHIFCLGTLKSAMQCNKSIITLFLDGGKIK